MAGTTIDRATFESLQQSAGAEFVAELVDTLLDEAPRMLAELRESLAARDAERFRRTAHSLKSNANTFGALSLAAMAKDLELTAPARVAAADSRPIDALAQELARTASALKEISRA